VVLMHGITSQNKDTRITSEICGDHTGYNYFRSTGCGVETMRRRQLRDDRSKFNGGRE
jgi:hypothetical protein